MFGTITTIFNNILYYPLFNALVLLYKYLPGHDFGVAIIVLTFIIRLILYFPSLKAIRSQKALSEIQPRIQEIQKTHKDDKIKQGEEMMELYKKAKINPFSGCLPTLIQLPFLIALYRVFWKGLRPEELVNLYSFVLNPGQISPNFLGIINLSSPNILLAVIAGIFQFLQTKMLTPKTKKSGKSSDFSVIMQKQMVYVFPVMTIVILWKLPSAIGLYWIVSSLFSVVQQYVIFKKYPRTI